MMEFIMLNIHKIFVIYIAYLYISVNKLENLWKIKMQNIYCLRNRNVYLEHYICALLEKEAMDLD